MLQYGVFFGSNDRNYLDDSPVICKYFSRPIAEVVYKETQTVRKYDMKLSGHVVASILMMGSLVSPAFAQGETPDSTFSENTMTFTTPGGAIMKRMVPANVMTNMMTKGAMPMTDGVMMMMHQGKMYMMHDQKMPDGKMMSDVAMGK